MQSVQGALRSCTRQAPSVAKNLKDKMHTVSIVDVFGKFGLVPALCANGYKYIREYKRFKMNGSWMKILFYALNNHSGNWILTWSTYIEKGLDGGTVFDKLYTEQRMEAEEQFTLRDDIPIKEKVSISTLYQLVDVINVSRKLYVFLYRESNRNKQQNIAFITDIDFNNITDADFCEKYKIEFTHQGRLIKMDWTDFRKKYKKN